MELLVVIAVIGILASFLLPALAASKQRAFTARCLSNLRQIGIGMSLYAEESQGILPESGGVILWGQTDPTTGRRSWTEQLLPFTLNTNVYNCPAIKGPFMYFNSARAAYIATTNYTAIDTKRMNFPSAQVLSGDTLWIGGAIQEVMADADKDDYTQNCVGGDANGIPAEGWQIHQQGQNLLFGDDHVKSYKRYDPNEMTFRYDSLHGWQ